MNRSSFLSSFINTWAQFSYDGHLPFLQFPQLRFLPFKRQSPTENKASPFSVNCSQVLCLLGFPQRGHRWLHHHTCYSYCNRPQFYFPPMLFPQNCSSFAKLGDCLIKKQCPWFRNGQKEIMYWLSQQWNTGVVFQSLEVVGKGDLIQWAMFFWLTGCR